jgi:hypothetical protein
MSVLLSDLNGISTAIRRFIFTFECQRSSCESSLCRSKRFQMIRVPFACHHRPAGCTFPIRLAGVTCEAEKEITLAANTVLIRHAPTTNVQRMLDVDMIL